MSLNGTPARALRAIRFPLTSFAGGHETWVMLSHTPVRVYMYTLGEGTYV